MPKRVRLRTLTDEEHESVYSLAASRTTEARLVQRAKVIVALLEDATLSASDAALEAGYKSKQSGTMWVKRFNEEGIAGLEDLARPGRPRDHSEQVRSQLISLGLQKPRTLGYPFELWTLERLQRAFKKRHGVHLSDSTIWTWMAEEGFEWKRQQSWFHNAEDHDSEFVEKRGRS